MHINSIFETVFKHVGKWVIFHRKGGHGFINIKCLFFFETGTCPVIKKGEWNMRGNRRNVRNMERRISRRGFVGGLAAGLGAAAIGMSGVAHADEIPAGCNVEDTYGDQSLLKVYPTGDPSIDPWCIQWAVDYVASNGTVQLMASNNNVYTVFDLEGSIIEINQNKNITILGQKLPGAVLGKDYFEGSSNAQFYNGNGTPVVMSDRTVIYRGGDQGYRNGVFNCNNSGTFSCSGLRFDYSTGHSIFLRKSQGANVFDNVVTGIKPSYLIFGGNRIFSFAVGIMANGHPATGGGSHRNAANITQPVNIYQNGIDVFGGGILQEKDLLPINFASGIGLSDYVNKVEFHISDNTIQNPGYAGIWTVGFYPTSTVYIDGNWIYQRRYPRHPEFWVTGINAYTHDIFPFGTFPVGKVEISNNHIFNCINEDIGLETNDSEISNNVMISNSSRNYSSLYLNGNNNLVENNDYTQSGCMGWNKSLNQWPSIFITQSAFDNYIDEHLFQPGTTLCNQIAEIPEIDSVYYFVADPNGDYYWNGHRYVPVTLQHPTGTHKRYFYQGCGSAGYDGLVALKFDYHETTDPLLLVDGSYYYPAICEPRSPKNTVIGLSECDFLPNPQPYLEEMKNSIEERHRRRMETLEEKLGKDLPDFPH